MAVLDTRVGYGRSPPALITKGVDWICPLHSLQDL